MAENAGATMTDSKSVIQVINTPTQTQISADVTYLTTGVRKASRKGRFEDDEEPLVDNTVALPKRSKKTDRAQRRLVQKQQKAAERPTAATLLDLPTELLEHVLGFLMPSDVLRLLSVSHTVQSFILETANAISRTIIRRRFGVLSRCFPLPVPFKDVESSAHPALLSERRQDMLQIHKKPYQHVKGIDPLKVCTCLSCVFAWNNLCLVLDLAYWQKTLDKKEPIPMIKRGSAPEWNRKLLDQNAEIVERAMEGDSLSYAMILEKHLRSTMGTLLRTYRGKKTVHPKRLYHFSAVEAEKESDEFLERSGPPSYEFPWHRDNYYALEAYVPNRKWSKEREQWLYYADGLHERDLQWVKDRFQPVKTEPEKLAQFIASFQEQVDNRQS